jgi:hypothetical protein
MGTPIAIAIDRRSQFGKTEDPSLTQLASADRVRTRDAAAGELREKRRLIPTNFAAS